MKYLIKLILQLVFAILISSNLFSQFTVKEFQTDSSSVELTKNSLYRIWKEELNNKDSVFYQVTFINDTSQIHVEGYHKKNGDYLGEWSEFKENGTWLYTIDYTNHSGVFNEDEFKFQSLKERMKLKADKYLINQFGQDFFENNIVFNFNGHLSINRLKMYGSDSSWVQDEYLGNWTTPISKTPNSFILDYAIKIDNNEIYHNMIRVELDSIGNLISNSSRFMVDLLDINPSRRMRFTLDKAQIIKLCRTNKIEDEDIENYTAKLRLGFRKLSNYPGRFYYEAISFISEEIDGDCYNDCLIKKFYYVWRYDPWTSQLLHKEKMVQYSRWNRGHGETGGFEKIDE